MEARELLENLNHPDEAIRHKATLALGGCGREHRAWAPDLIAAVNHGSPGIRFWAATALGRIGADPAQAVPPLIALLSDPDKWGNRQVAASALAKIGRPAAKDAVPALARVLATDDNHFVREYVVRSLRTLAVWNADAIKALSEALDDPDEGVRREAARQLSGLGERAHDAVPALRRLLERENEPEAVRSEAASALERILSGAPALRYDEPYRSLSEAASKGRFTDSSVPEEVRRRLGQEDLEGAFQLLEAEAKNDQDSSFWIAMFLAAREFDLPSQHRHYERYLETSGTGGFWRELEGVIHSELPVSKGMRRMIRYCSRVEPNPGWKRFYKLEIDEDLSRLKAWLEAAFTEEPPPDDVPGLWFGLVDVDRGGEPSLDLYVSGGHPDDEEPEDRVIGGSWEPRNEYARSGVLDEIYKVAHAVEGDALEEAHYHLGLAGRPGGPLACDDAWPQAAWRSPATRAGRWLRRRGLDRRRHPSPGEPGLPRQVDDRHSSRGRAPGPAESRSMAIPLFISEFSDGPDGPLFAGLAVRPRSPGPASRRARVTSR